MHNKVGTGILLLVSLVLLEFVSGLPLDGQTKISSQGSDESHGENKDPLLSLIRKTRDTQTFVDLSDEQNGNEDLTPSMETQFVYGTVPNVQPRFGGFVHWNPKNKNGRHQYDNFDAINTDHHGKFHKGKPHWTFEQDYFRNPNSRPTDLVPHGCEPLKKSRKKQWGSDDDYFKKRSKTLE